MSFIGVCSFYYGATKTHFENLIPFSSAKLNNKIPNLHREQAKLPMKRMTRSVCSCLSINSGLLDPTAGAMSGHV